MVGIECILHARQPDRRARKIAMPMATEGQTDVIRRKGGENAKACVERVEREGAKVSTEFHDTADGSFYSFCSQRNAS